MNWHAFWAMGGYAWYVWPVYGLGILILLANIAWPLYRAQRLRQQLLNLSLSPMNTLIGKNKDKSTS
ncbi:MAG: hypothetical protein Tsb005_02860 [Gammaproteobacteria bacterium]